MNMNRWCLGFIFNPAKTEVLLLEKSPDSRQFPNMLNGIGGGVEPGETPLMAMERETMEETGITPVWIDEEGGIGGTQTIQELTWREFAVLQGTWGWLHCFTATMPVAFDQVKLTAHATDEGILVSLSLGFLAQREYRQKLVPNARYLIPMALDKDAPVARIREGDVDPGKKFLNLGFKLTEKGQALLFDRSDGAFIENHLLLHDQIPVEGEDPNQTLAVISLMQPGFVATLTIKLLIRAEGIAALAEPGSAFIEDGDKACILRVTNEVKTL